MHYWKVGKDPLLSKKLQVSTLLIIRVLQPSYSALTYNDQKRQSLLLTYIVSIVTKQKINLSTLWLCKLHIKHKPTPHWLAKPLGKNKLQTSAVAQNNLVKRVAAQNCHWRKQRQQCSEFHTVLPWRSYKHHLQQHSELTIISEVSETEYHSSTLTATRQLTTNSREKKGKI